MVKYIPGLIAAATAFLVTKLSVWTLLHSAWPLSFTEEILIFLVIYVAVTFVVDIAIRRYS